MPVVHQLTAMSKLGITVRCGAHVTYGFEWSGWDSDITCKECIKQ